MSGRPPLKLGPRLRMRLALNPLPKPPPALVSKMGAGPYEPALSGARGHVRRRSAARRGLVGVGPFLTAACDVTASQTSSCQSSTRRASFLGLEGSGRGSWKCSRERGFFFFWKILEDFDKVREKAATPSLGVCVSHGVSSWACPCSRRRRFFLK